MILKASSDELPFVGWGEIDGTTGEAAGAGCALSARLAIRGSRTTGTGPPALLEAEDGSGAEVMGGIVVGGVRTISTMSFPESLTRKAGPKPTRGLSAGSE